MTQTTQAIYSYNVPSQRFRVTILAVEKLYVLHILSVCL